MTDYVRLYEGGTARVTFTFRDADNPATLVDPPVVASWRLLPNGSWTTFTTANLSDNVFRGTFPVAAAGVYAAKCVTGGIEPAVAYGEVQVLPTG